VGSDGILGELQIGAVGRVPEQGGSVVHQRLEALANHDLYIDAIRRESVDEIMAAHSPQATAALRSYLTDESSLLDAPDPEGLRTYFAQLFQRYHVRDIRLVNRLVQSWYIFAELHWIVEERSGERRTLEFCTAELSPLDPNGKYWIRTGSGTDPVEA
jgi:hypothetical protein